MSNNNLLRIDVDEILKSKAGKKYDKIPKFLIRYLKKILHQEELNVFLAEHPESKDLEFVEDSIKFIDLTVKFEGLENIPDTGRFIFVANHPLGGLESLAMMQVISKKYKDLVFIVNDMLMFLTPLKNIFVPVNKLGTQSRQYVEMINNAYFSDKQILYFPAGLCSRKIKGKIVDLEWQKNFIQKSKESKRNIIPIFIKAKNSNFFYNLAKFRKIFGIKFNIEMLYLVNEMFKQRGQTLNLKIGTPIPFSNFDNSKTVKEWAQEVKKIVYSLEQSSK